MNSKALKLVNTNEIDQNILRQLNDFSGEESPGCTSLPFMEDLFDAENDYQAFMGLSAPGASVYHFGQKYSRSLNSQTSLQELYNVDRGDQAYHRFVCSAHQSASRFLVSLDKYGLDQGLIKDHLEHQAVDAPYLLAADHGLLGMALIDASVQAGQYRTTFEQVGVSRSEGICQVSHEVQDVLLPGASRWLATLRAPIRFNRFQPANYRDFLPESPETTRWLAFKDRYRSAEYQFALPAGVSSVVLHLRGSLTAAPINDHNFSAAYKHPVVVTFPSGTIVLMCVNSLDGFGSDRYSIGKSPLLDWGVKKMAHRGGLASIFRHGLQRTIYALLAEEVAAAFHERRRPCVPWVAEDSRPLLPVVLDSAVIHPKPAADDVYGGVLQNLMV